MPTFSTVNTRMQPRRSPSDRRTFSRVVFATLLLSATFGGTVGQAQELSPAEQTAFFENRIRPVLVEHCYECHSERSDNPQGGLRLDYRQSVLEGGESGPAVVPGEPEQSLLIEAVRYESLEMPPKGKLPEAAIDDLVRWVSMGAPDPREGTAPAAASSSPAEAPDHWAFQPLLCPPLPPVLDRTWPTAGSDYFILRRLEELSLRPADDADRYTWLRRVSFDLTGLPPTIAQIRSFADDKSPRAYETVVDRLLTSPAFGERWARHWLDLVGYADQIGTSNNVFAEHAWRYRDYVIDSYNHDLPFDRFIREQLAGDLLSSDSVEAQAAAITATGFLLLGDLEIVEADKAKLRVDIVDQQVVKTSKAFLGMTVGCARCHDHKFDPISQREYYAMAGFFHNTQSVYKTQRGVWSDVVQRELPETPAQQAARAEAERQHAARLTQWTAERDQARSQLAEIEKQLGPETSPDAPSTREALMAQRSQLGQRIAQLGRQLEHAQFFAPGMPRVYAVRDLDNPTGMRITIRGNPRALGDEVPRGFLHAVSPPATRIPAEQSGRRELADWIASPRNPLTARVAVNRVWQKLFGAGLAPSVDYFGLRAEPPTHPKLLDYLATEFIRGGWSQKSLIRTLVLSRAYRMSSAHDEVADAVDPTNRLLWRMNRRRLDAEALRDALLAIGDQLLFQGGGPALPLELVENVANLDPKNVNPPSFSLSRWRPEQASQRTIYLPIIRSGAQPGPAEIRNVFDFVQPAEFTGQRPNTAVPTQALFLMNSPDIKQYASQLAERIQREATDAGAQLESLWLCTLNRPITINERRQAQQFLAEVGETGWVELCHAIVAANEFLMTL